MRNLIAFVVMVFWCCVFQWVWNWSMAPSYLPICEHIQSYACTKFWMEIYKKIKNARVECGSPSRRRLKGDKLVPQVSFFLFHSLFLISNVDRFVMMWLRHGRPFRWSSLIITHCLECWRRFLHAPFTSFICGHLWHGTRGSCLLCCMWCTRLTEHVIRALIRISFRSHDCIGNLDRGRA